MSRRSTSVILATAIVFGASTTTEADLVRYTFSFAGAVGSLDGAEFVAAEASFSLFAELEDIQPGSPRGFNVTPGSGFLTIDGESVEMTSAFVTDSAVWTYSDPADGLVIGFGLYVPFENLTIGTYDGPLGWDLATPFSGGGRWWLSQLALDLQVPGIITSTVGPNARGQAAGSAPGSSFGRRLDDVRTV